MNIKAFLLDNYIWIIVVLLLLIITIVGFLADKKSGNKKTKDKVNQDVPVAPTADNSQINYQPNFNNGMNMNNSNMMVDNLNNQMGDKNMNQFDFNSQMNTIPNSVNNIQAVNNFNQLQPNSNNNFSNVTQSVPLPTENISNMQNVPAEPMQQSTSLNNSQFVSNGNEAVLQNMNQSTNVNNNGINSFNQNEMPYQSTSSQKPSFAPREVVLPNQDNFNQNVQQNGEMGQINTIPNPVTPPQEVKPQLMDPLPVNFVYGSQGINNNQNMGQNNNSNLNMNNNQFM